jgi:hypothetical protein
MKLLTLLAACLFLSSCSVHKLIPVSEDHYDPKTIETSSSFDQVWDKLIDVFAQNGMSIKVIDRSSGVIVSERSLLPSTIELDPGKLKNPTAYAVLPRVRYATRDKPLYYELTGEWNLRLKKSDKGTLVFINIGNVEGKYTAEDDHSNVIVYKKLCPTCKSTGVFEDKIADVIK